MADEQTRSVQLQLPIGLVTRMDAGRLAGEAEAVDNFLRQAAIRAPGTSVQLPKTSRLFDEMVSINNLNMLQELDRQRLTQFLQAVRTTAPILHISFNVDPSPIFQQRLTTWIRQQMHPFILLQIGLHPNIGAGCVVRATNKYYDFSLRQRFKDQKMLLISKLTGADELAKTPVAASLPATETPAK
ncbi:MAG: hypothetical protein V4702_02155 [Patescibacteria group bacterium]